MANEKSKTTHFLYLLFWTFFFIYFLFPDTLKASTQTKDKLKQLCKNGGYAIEVNGKIVEGYRINDSFIPASTIKLATNLAALTILGPQYRYTTHFYVDKRSNLYIQGQGDPYLVSENIRLIAAQLLQKGLSNIQTLVLDTSNFSLEKIADGATTSQNPYDAANDAVNVNFNTLPIHVDRHGIINSAEPQTPFVPLMKDIGKHLSFGTHRVNVDAYPAQHTIPNRSRYAGEVFLAILQEKGFSTAGIDIKTGMVPDDALLFHTYHSDQTLEDLVRSNLKYSNNFIANQLFLTCGRMQFGPPATWEKGRKSLDRFLREQLGLHEKDIRLVEGSGISRKNRATPKAMLKILHAFRPYTYLLPMKKGIKMKSGTLRDVFSYAGYFEFKKNQDPFILFLNQKMNTRDQMLELLSNRYKKERQEYLHNR